MSSKAGWRWRSHRPKTIPATTWRVAAARGGGRLRDGTAVRRGRRGTALRERRDPRLPEGAPPVRRADRELPGAAAPDGGHDDLVRAGEIDGGARVRHGGWRARSWAEAPHRLGGQDPHRRRRASREPGIG